MNSFRAPVRTDKVDHSEAARSRSSSEPREPELGTKVFRYGSRWSRAPACCTGPSPDYQTRQFVGRVDFNPRITTALSLEGLQPDAQLLRFAKPSTGPELVKRTRSVRQDFLRSSREIRHWI